MTETVDAAAALRVALDGGEAFVDIAGAALACSALANPGLDLAPYRRHLADLVREVGEARDGGRDPWSALCAVLVERHGYRGDRETYDDIANADLAAVIDRRKGLPVALSILWMHAARAQGWRCAGLNFPGHFLLRLDAGSARQIIDPFEGGERRSPADLGALLRRIDPKNAELHPEHVTTVDDRAVLLRLQNNIKSRLRRGGDPARALAVVERMLIIAPRAGDLWCEAATLNAATDKLRAALDCLDRAAALAGTEAARQRIRVERAQLAGKLN
jgi:regulator of sirC expression with transglutaminase-like and TPR domain